MSNRTKQRRTGGLTLLLYQRTLHPELFRILASEQVSRRAYEADIWLVEGGHVISFTAGKNTLTEVILANNEPLTDRGLLQTIPCRGEKYHEMTAGREHSVHDQHAGRTVDPDAVRRHEARDFQLRQQAGADECRDVVVRRERMRPLSVLDIERRSHELLVQSFHLFDENQMVIKTQAIIEVIKGA